MKLRYLHITFVFLILLYLVVAIYLVNSYGTTLILEYTRYGHDNKAHLYIPRTVVDNGDRSRLANLGTVWLPLYHISLIPFILVDYLYVTGLAGALVNIISVVITSYLIWRLIKGKLGVIAALIFGSNFYTVLHAVSSYMIPLGQTLFIASAYFFSRYVKKGNFGYLSLASLFLMLATVTRYEAWIPLVTFTVLLMADVGRDKWIVRAAYLVPAYYGVAGWLLYNQIIFGNFLEFVYHPSPGARGYYYWILSTMLKAWNYNFSSMFWVLFTLAGPSLILLPLGITYMVKNGETRLLLYIISPLVFALAENPYLAIGDHPLYFFFLLPSIIVISFKGLAYLGKHFNKIVLIASSFLVVINIIMLIGSLNSLLTATDMAYSQLIMDKQLADDIKRMVGKGGYILSSSITMSIDLSVLSGLSPQYIIDEFDGDLYSEASMHPWNSKVVVLVLPDQRFYIDHRALFIGLGGDNNYVTLFFEDSKWRNEFLSHYEVIYKGDFWIYGVKVTDSVREGNEGD